MSPDELVKQAQDHVAQGFQAMKLGLGRPSVQEDLDRVRDVWEAIGPDVTLLTVSLFEGSRLVGGIRYEKDTLSD